MAHVVLQAYNEWCYLVSVCRYTPVDISSITMDQPTLEDVIKTSAVVVHPDRYAYLQCAHVQHDSHFLVSRDNDELTVVTKESNVATTPHIKSEKWFRLIEIRVSVPFITKGFLAKVTKTIADERLNVLVVSTFSKDYILVRDETHGVAVEALRKVGFPVHFGEPQLGKDLAGEL